MKNREELLLAIQNIEQAQERLAKAIKESGVTYAGPVNYTSHRLGRELSGFLYLMKSEEGPLGSEVVSHEAGVKNPDGVTVIPISINDLPKNPFDLLSSPPKMVDAGWPAQRRDDAPY